MLHKSISIFKEMVQKSFWWLGKVLSMIYCLILLKMIKLWQNKKGPIFVCHACQNHIFFTAGSWKKRRHSGKLDKQISGPFYFVRALGGQIHFPSQNQEVSKLGQHNALQQFGLGRSGACSLNIKQDCTNTSTVFCAILVNALNILRIKQYG